MEQVAKSGFRRSNRREPLAFAFFGLILFMVVYFARPEDWIPGLSAVPLAKIAGILILLALAFSSSQIHWHMPQEVIFLSLLVAQLWLAAVFSPVWRGGAVNVMLDFSKVVPLFIVIYAAVRSMKRLRWILFVQAASVAAIALVSILNRHASGGRLQGILIYGISGNSNDLALVIDISLPLCLTLALTTRSYWAKIAWIVAMLAMIYAVALTASRAGAIALTVAGLACLWQLGVKGRRLYLILLVPVAVIAIWLSSGKALQQRFEQTEIDPARNQHSTEASASTEQRKELLLKSLKITADHPIFGVGPGNFEIVSGVWHVTHNSYTQISAEGGIPSFLLYLFIFWSAIANLRKTSRYRKSGEGRLFSMALQASLAAYLVGSFFGSLAYQLFPYYLVAYSSALRLIVERQLVVPSAPSKSDPAPAAVEVTVWQ